MLKKLEIENFRSFKKAEIELRRLNVLIGPNGGGKSNFLDIFNLFSQAAEGRLADGFINRDGFEQVAFKEQHSDYIRFIMEFDYSYFFENKGLNFIYDVILVKRGESAVPIIMLEKLWENGEGDDSKRPPLIERNYDKIKMFNCRTKKVNDFSYNLFLEKASSGYPEEFDISNELTISLVERAIHYPIPSQLTSKLSSLNHYHPIPVEVSSPIRCSQLTKPGTNLSDDGGNLLSVLNNIQSNYPDFWEEIINLLKTFYPGFYNITFPIEGGAGKAVLKWWERIGNKNEYFYANQLSDGTLRLLTLIAILMNPKPPPLICIDEPELSMHPDWIHLLAELMQSASERTQMIVATHSPQLISKLEPEEVVIVEKEDGESHLRRLDADSLQAWLEEYTLGELWMSGHIGGRSK